MTIKAWTDTENSACIALYFTMLDSAIAGKPYNKAAMIRNARETNAEAYPGGFYGLLRNRSRGSIEAKLMNCSAAHRDLAPHAVTMERFGYRALPNYQRALRDAMAEYLDAHTCETGKALIGLQS